MFNYVLEFRVSNNNFAFYLYLHIFSDVSQTIFWVVVFLTGVYLQHRQSLGKPPFPPHRSGVEVADINERTRLLQPELPPPYRP